MCPSARVAVDWLPPQPHPAQLSRLTPLKRRTHRHPPTRPAPCLPRRPPRSVRLGPRAGRIRSWRHRFPPRWLRTRSRRRPGTALPLRCARSAFRRGPGKPTLGSTATAAARRGPQPIRPRAWVSRMPSLIGVTPAVPEVRAAARRAPMTPTAEGPRSAGAAGAWAWAGPARTPPSRRAAPVTPGRPARTPGTVVRVARAGAVRASQGAAVQAAQAGKVWALSLAVPRVPPRAIPRFPPSDRGGAWQARLVSVWLDDWIEVSRATV